MYITNVIASSNVDFYINGPSNLTEMVPPIGVEGTVSRTYFPYTRDHLTLGIGRLIKSAAME